MTEKPRVLIAAPTMARGGTERHLVYLASSISVTDIDLAFVLLAPNGPLEPELLAAGARVLSAAEEMRRPFRTIEQARLIAREVVRWRPHVVHSFLSEPHFAAALGIALAGPPHPALVHGRRSTNFYAAARPLAAKAERALHRCCAALIGNSSAIARELAMESRAPEKVAVIHNGIPLTHIDAMRPSRSAARKQLALSEGTFVMAVVSNFHDYKRHTDVLSALARIKDQLPRPWCLLLAGRDAGERAALERQAETAGLAGVVFLGETADTGPVHAAADLELLVSLQEGFSNALLEAMVAGVPAIVSDCGGNPDAVIHGETGLIVSPRDPSRLAGAILELSRNHERRRTYGAAARARAIRCFTMEACAARYIALWRGLKEGRALPVADWLDPLVC